MKTRYDTFTLVDDPTLQERLDFLEKGLREIANHERMCESRRPALTKEGWRGKVKTTFPYPCDCWLSNPLGSVGLRKDISE